MAEITFNNPQYLWFLVSLPILIAAHFYLLRHSKKKAMKFANFETIKRVTGEKLITKNLLVLTSRIFIIVFFVMGVSGAVLWYYGDSNKNNFVIAIDTSASMTAEDIQPTRIEAAKSNAKHFVDLLRSDAEIGLISFSGVPLIEETMSKNKNEIKNSIEEIDIVHAGGTDIPGAIVAGTNLLANSEKGKSIIMISDGSSTMGAFLDDAIAKAIAYAQDNHVIIYTVGTGINRNDPLGYIPKYYNISSVYNEENMKRIANMTGGRYYHVVDQQKLIDSLREISENDEKAWLHLELAPMLMFASLIMLFFEWGIINIRYGKRP